MIFSSNSRLARALQARDGSLIDRLGIYEALDMTRKAPGEVPFRTSSLADPHIQALIRDAAAKTGVSEADITKHLKGKIKEIEELKRYSPILYDTIAKDAVSQAAFDLVDVYMKGRASRVQFDIPMFMKLVKIIELEHDEFFPVRAPGELNYIYHIEPILVPTTAPELKKFNSINTAAATGEGDFIFNVPFMQKLMDWATVEGLKPKGLKYASNGGPIPDAYAYIEFVIMHELLHYSMGDFKTGKRLKQYDMSDVHNMAMDFRSNYVLVKSGYDQLPIGLFSDHINYDRQERYDDMAKLVYDELKKLPKPLQDAVKKVAKMDEHPKPSDGKDNKDGKKDNKKSAIKVGDVVRHNDGSFGKVTSINADGSVDIDPIADPSNGGKK